MKRGQGIDRDSNCGCNVPAHQMLYI